MMSQASGSTGPIPTVTTKNDIKNSYSQLKNYGKKQKEDQILHLLKKSWIHILNLFEY